MAGNSLETEPMNPKNTLAKVLGFTWLCEIAPPSIRNREEVWCHGSDRIVLKPFSGVMAMHCQRLRRLLATKSRTNTASIAVHNRLEAPPCIP